MEIEELLSEQENLKTALEDAKAEIKMLNSKLAASRSAETANMRYPGSALKNKPAAARQVSNNEAAQLGQIKNKLYEDLTGLIITSVKTSADEDVFDCLQTGRNGSKYALRARPPMHFHHFLRRADTHPQLCILNYQSHRRARTMIPNSSTIPSCTRVGTRI